MLGFITKILLNLLANVVAGDMYYMNDGASPHIRQYLHASYGIGREEARAFIRKK